MSAALAKLPDDQRDAIVFHHLQGLKLAEVSTEMGRSESSVAGLLFRDLETICLKCLEKEPHRRYGTAQLLAQDLQRFLNGEPINARSISPPARLWRWCRRQPVIASLTVLLLLALASVTAITNFAYFRDVAHGIELQRTLDDRDKTIVASNLRRHRRKLAHPLHHRLNNQSPKNS